jgi:phospholipid/cholesterol/gamma-HCH transport system permease protein
MGPASNASAKYFISKGIDQFFTGVYEISRFVLQFFKEAFTPPYEFREVIRQCYKIGYKSLPLISLTGFIVGIVFTDHSRPALASFGATSWLPATSGVAIIKALAPLITSLICAGKVGSQIGAELGSMKVTEQIDAMEVSATNPFKFLVVTRVLATTFMVPLLMLYMALLALMGAFVNVHTNEQTSFISFIENGFHSINFIDIFSSVLKSIVFGFTIGIMGCYQGYNTSQGTQGVGRAANSSVVMAMFLIFIEEIVIVQITNWFRP